MNSHLFEEKIWFQAISPEFRAYQEQVLKNSSRFANVCIHLCGHCFLIKCHGIFIWQICKYTHLSLSLSTILWSNPKILVLLAKGCVLVLLTKGYVQYFIQLEGHFFVFFILDSYLIVWSSLLQALVAKGYDLVSGGTDNHLVLVNLKSKVLTARFSMSLVLWIFFSFLPTECDKRA